MDQAEIEGDQRGARAWALAVLRASSPSEKLSTRPSPSHWETTTKENSGPLEAARGPGFVITHRAPKSVRPGALTSSRARARLLHTFLHHEVQAAELACQGLLRFSETPLAFRRGLLGIAQDELRHARLYRDRIRELGMEYGDEPVRDWILERGATCQTPIAFVAFFGLGLEGGNLEHSRRFADLFRAAGDEASAQLQEQIAREEVAHVRFSREWFETWTDGRFDTWREHLPEPLTPALFRGRTLDRDARERAGQSASFLDAFEAWSWIGS